MPESAQLARLRAGIARAEHNSQLTGDTAPALDARREYAAARIEDYVRRVVDSAPPLSAEQRARLAVLLLSPTSGTPPEAA